MKLTEGAVGFHLGIDNRITVTAAASRYANASGLSLQTSYSNIYLILSMSTHLIATFFPFTIYRPFGS